MFEFGASCAEKFNYFGNESATLIFLLIGNYFLRREISNFFIKISNFGMAGNLTSLKRPFSAIEFRSRKSSFTTIHFFKGKMFLKMFNFTDSVSSFPYGWMVLNFDLGWAHFGMDADPLILDWASRRRGSLTMIGLLDLILGEDQFGAFMLPLGSWWVCFKFWPPW